MKPEMLESISCPNCNEEDSRHWATENGFHTVRCVACSLLYVNPRPVRSYTDAAVSTGLHAGDGKDVDVSARRIGTKVARYRRVLSEMFSDCWRRDVPVSWLDVGAGYGELIEAVIELAPPGSDVTGLEPMRPKAAAARVRGLPVEEAWLHAGRPKVDVVSLSDVFSHIPDFNEFLSTVRAVLRPGGELFIETGNLADVARRDEFPNELGLPDHLVFAGESQMRAYLDRAGFEIIRIERVRFDDLWNFAKIVVKRLLGRPVLVALPYRSSYRQLLIRARLRDGANEVRSLGDA